MKTTSETTKEISATLRALGFKGSVRTFKTSVEGWTVIKGTASKFGTFTESEKALLHAATGITVGLSDEATFTPAEWAKTPAAK